MAKKDIIRRLLGLGAPYREIERAANCSKSTISYHAEKMGIAKGQTPRYDWDKVQKHHDAGYSRMECMERFGFSHSTWTDAVNSGRLRARDHRIPMSELLVEGRNTKRTHLKMRLLRDHLLEPKCYNCGITEWHGGSVSLELHHLDGNGKNNRLENLQLLCPNCHSQTITWGGRNRGKK